jgi:hypothetical protein
MREAIEWRSAVIVGPDREKIGDVTDVYLDDVSARPSFVVVRTGFLGMARPRFIPVADGVWNEDERTLEVPWDRAAVLASPELGTENELTPDLEARIRAYYAGLTPGGRVQEAEAASSPPQQS